MGNFITLTNFTAGKMIKSKEISQRITLGFTETIMYILNFIEIYNCKRN